MRFGFDIHGVLDTKPKLYSKLTKRLVMLGHEVHVITGASITDRLVQQLKDWGIAYHKLFSIADYHKKLGTPINYSDSDNPWMDEKIWDRTKAEYCDREAINLHIDDSPEYGKYFKSTIYLEIKK